FRNKAKSIQKCCQALAEKFGGKVPKDPEDLVKLPGIGRKTANMILANAYGTPGIIVDTHVLRLSKRLGLSKKDKADAVAEDLAALIPKKKWALVSYQLVDHGRAVCKARKPACDTCNLESFCPKIGVS
ncbi:MAG: endonuclease III, partial [bacterium]|nr:endonuclease III [bacterium]